jgi:spermidine/putrescine transport system substrate-binding protein
VYTWSDYVKPDLVARFEAEHKCRVVIDTFDTNETMYAKLKAGATGYDLITPSSYMGEILWKQGMLETLDHTKLSNAAQTDPEVLRASPDPEMEYSVPYMLSNTGIAFLASKVPGAEPSWSLFDRPEVAGRCTVLNDMREAIGAALKSLGYSLNTTSDAELAAAKDVVLRWKKSIAKFENEQYKGGIASGEFFLVHAYNGDILQVMPENEDIRFVVPREGTSMSSDDFVIPKGAKALQLAHAWIQFFHDPQVAAENSEYVQYLCPNLAAYPLLSAEFMSNPAIFMDTDTRAKSEVIRDLGPDNAKYVKIWDEIKAG